MDHFGWNPIGTNQVAGMPFPVVVTAKDGGGQTFSSFTDSVTLSAHFEDQSATMTPSATGHFVDGVWTGLVTVVDTATNVMLRADDGAGHIGDSNPFNADPLKLFVVLPDSITEGGADALAEVVANVPPDVDLQVMLNVDLPNEVILPQSVLIPAGQTNVSFSLQAVDDSLLDGTVEVSISASTANLYQPGSSSFYVHDNETATFTLSLPQNTYEGVGQLEGTLLMDSPPDIDVLVKLRSSDTNEITSTAVVIPAGQTVVPVVFDVIDDDLNDGVKAVAVNAFVNNWIGNTCHVFVFDNEQAASAPEKPENPGEVPETFKLVEVGLLTNVATVSKIEYCPERDLLCLMSGNDVRIIRASSGQVLNTHIATETFTDMDLTRDGQYLFIADYGGERTGYGTPINPHYVHRYDLNNNVWLVAQAPKIAWKIEAVSPDRVLLQEHDQHIDMTLNSFGTTMVELSRIRADYYGDLEYDPITKRAYHGSSGSSSREIHVRTISGDSLINSGDTGVYGTAQSGGGTSTLSTDGAYFFYGRLQVNALNIRSNIRALPENIYAASSRIALGKNSYYSVKTGIEKGAWGFTSGALGVSEDGKHIWVYESATSTLHHYIDAAVPNIALPADAQEADGLLSMSGSLCVTVAPESDLLINLSSSDPNEVEVPASVMLLAGETNVSFDIVILDDALVDGSQPITIHAEPNQQNYADSEGVIVVHDNESATLSLSLPQSTVEGFGGISGMVNVSPNADQDVVVTLISDNPGKISHGSIVIKAGDAGAAFTLSVLDDDLIDGLQTATIEARVENWDSASAAVFIADNETTDIKLKLPALTMEGDGTVTNAGEVFLSGTLSTDVHILLQSLDVSEVEVPLYVTIPAGQTNAFFNISVVDDDVVDGKQYPTITASAPGLVPGSLPMRVSDNEFHHFTLVGFDGEDPGYVPVPCSVHAVNMDDEYVDTYSGPAWLSGILGSDPASVDPSESIGLTNGVWQGSVTFHGMGDDARIMIDDGQGHVGTIPITLGQFNIVKMATDWELPYVYMVHKAETSPNRSALIWYNTDTEMIEYAAGAGENVTDLTVHYGDNRIYVSNWRRADTRVFDRTTMQEQEPLKLGSDVYHINTASAGRVITEGEDQWVRMSMRSTTNSSEIAYKYSVREGDADTTLDGRYHYHCDNNSSGATIQKYDITADSFVQLASKRTKYYYGSRNIFVNMDGTRVYNCGTIYDADLKELLDLKSEIYAASAYGDLVLTATKAFNGVSGAELYTLPFSSPVMAFSGDQQKLMLFDATTGSITSLLTSAIMPIPEPTLIPVPEVGSLQGANLPALSWSAAPAATGYNVYIGTDSNAVASAATNSVQYLGRMSETKIELLEGSLAGDKTYYWRVDIVAFGDQIVQGDIWTFGTSKIAVDPYEIIVDGVTADYTQRVSVAVSNMIGVPVSWSVSCTNDWVSLGVTGGTGSGNLSVGVDLSEMEPGTYSADLLFNDGTGTLTVPIHLTAEQTRLVKMVADWMLPYIYLAHTSATSPYKSRLIWYNTDTDSIEHVVDAGENVTDIAVHYAENRVYVSNHGRAETRRFDRSTKVEEDPLLIGTDVYHIEAGRQGRVFTAKKDWIANLFAYDTTNGIQLAKSSSVYPGDSASTLDGQYLYYVESYSSGDTILKYDMSADIFAKVKEVSVAGSRNMLLSMDGERIFANSRIYNADLNQVGDLGAEVYATSAYADLLVTSTKAFNGVSGEEMYTLPFTTTIMAISGDQSELLLYNSTSGSITSIATSVIMPVPTLDLQPDPANGSVQGTNLSGLAWSEAPGAIGYDVYMGTDSNAVANAASGSPEYVGRVTDELMPLTNGVLSVGKTYYWRVDAVGFGGVAAVGKIHHFVVSELSTDVAELNLAALDADYNFAAQIALETPGTWSGTTDVSWLSLVPASGNGAENVAAIVDASQLDGGIHAGTVQLQDSNGLVLQVPVTVEVFPMNITKMETDVNNGKLYALNVVQEGLKPSQLVILDVSGEQIEYVVSVVDNALDFAVHYGDDRIYASAFGKANVSVIDRSDFQRLEDLTLNTHVYRISSGIAGRLVTEDDGTGNAYYGRMRVWDSLTGGLLQTTAAYTTGRGTGESVADGSLYYRGDSTSYPYSGMLRKYDLSGGTLAGVKSISATKSSRRELVLSGDGSRVFWTGKAYDSDLNLITNLPAEVFAASWDGSKVASASQVYHVDSGTLLATLPATVPAAAFASNDSRLVFYNPSSGAVEWMALSSGVPGAPPAVPLADVAASDEYAEWTTSYFPYLTIAPDAMVDSDLDGQVNMDEYG